jgi:hypothetical protein
VDQEFEIVEELDISKYNSVEGMKKMARNTKNVALFMKNDFIDEYTKRKGRLSKTEHRRIQLRRIGACHSMEYPSTK